MTTVIDTKKQVEVYEWIRRAVIGCTNTVQLERAMVLINKYAELYEEDRMYRDLLAQYLKTLAWVDVK